MKLAILLSALLLSTAARAESPAAFFDLSKVLTDSDEGKKNAADEKADLAAKQAEVTAAEADWKKADAGCSKTAQLSTVKTCADGVAAKAAHLTDVSNRDQQEIAQRQQTDQQRLMARVGRVLPAVAKARHLGAVVPLGGAFYAGPTLDVTADVVKRLNAGEGQPPEATAQEVAQLRRQVATLEAENAALTKPPAPAVPPAPPTAPAKVASKGK